MTVVQLQARCKKRNRGCSKMKRAELIKTIKPTMAGYDGKQRVRKVQIRCGTPRIRKAQRNAARMTRLKNMPVVKLRALCKKKEIRGYSKMRKDELIKKIIREEKKRRLEREEKKRFEKIAL